MLKRPAPEQTALKIVTLDQLVPADHLLRKIERAIDFSFAHDLTATFYCADIAYLEKLGGNRDAA